MSVKSLRVLFVSPIPSEGASARHRITLYFSFLRSSGVKCVFRPFISKRFYRRLYQKGNLPFKALAMTWYVLRRCFDLPALLRCDVLFVHREAAMVGPPLFEWFAVKILRKPMVFDLDDAVFVRYRSPTYGKFLARLKFPTKAKWLVGSARTVVAGNEFLAAYARGRAAAKVEIMPTIVDTQRIKPAEIREGNPPVIGWVGSHSTTKYLAVVATALKELSATHSFTIRIVGAIQDLHLLGLDPEYVPWTEEAEVEELAKMDIGIYPLFDDDWSRGKSGYKAIQFFAAGIPCVATPIGASRMVVRDGVDGFHARTTQEWADRVRKLLEDPALRERMGKEGRKRAIQEYSLEKHAPEMLRILKEAAIKKNNR